MKNKVLYADLALLLVAFVWGAGFVASKESLTVTKPFYMMAIRFSMSFFLLGICYIKKFKNFTLKDIKNGSIVGIFLFLAFAAQTVGLQFTQAAKQAFLTGTNVVMVPFLYWIISKKRPNIYSITSAFMCLIGIALLTLQNGLYINLGDSLTLLCAVFFALHIVSVGHFTKSTDPIALTLIQFMVAAILSIIVALFTEPLPGPFNTRGVLALLYLGIFSTMVAFLLQNIAQKHTSSTHAAIILCTESVFGSLLSMLILGEKFTIEMFIGCIIIFTSIIISETKLEFLKKNKNNLVEKNKI